MNVRLDQLLELFEALVEHLRSRYDVEELGEHIVVLKPKHRTHVSSPRDVHLTLLGLVHGVEVAGLAVVCAFMTKLVDGDITLEEPVGVALGNVPAAKLGVRFVERDLNRSFGRASQETAEDRRAGEIEVLLNRTKYMVDFHQVKRPTASPFWIFPHHKEGFSFARNIAPEVPIVTHWGTSFSNDGQCSDEFLMKKGGTGVTIELGQNGWDNEQISLGLRIAEAALGETRVRIGDETRGSQSKSHSKAPVYTWAAVVPYPQTGKPVLDPDWTNFASVEAGQRLGSFEGKDVKAPVSGWLLFPKYPDPRQDGTYGESPPAAELVRIMRQVSESELPS